MDWYSIWPVKALVQRLACCCIDSQPESGDIIAMKVTSDYDLLPNPAHVKLGLDYVDLKHSQFHWHYDGPEPDKRLAAWVQDLFGTAICVKVVSPKTGRANLQRSFSSLSGGFTRFLACIKEGKRADIGSIE